MTNAEVVAQFAERLWGRDWVGRMSTFTEINERTLRRIWAAARYRQEYPAARGVIEALAASLDALRDDLEPWAQRADQPSKEPT